MFLKIVLNFLKNEKYPLDPVKFSEKLRECFKKLHDIFLKIDQNFYKNGTKFHQKLC